MMQSSLTRFIGLSFLIHALFFISAGSFYIENKKDSPLRIRLIQIPEIKENPVHKKKVYFPKPADNIKEEDKNTETIDTQVVPVAELNSFSYEDTPKSTIGHNNITSMILNNSESMTHKKEDAESREQDFDNDIISLDTKELKYSPYFDSIKRKINSVWRYPDDAIARGISGSLTLRFSISKDGALMDVKLLKPTNHRILDDEAVRAVKTAAQFDKFPPAIAQNHLNIVATFSYRPYFVSQNEML
jgi:TonB family protein